MYDIIIVGAGPSGMTAALYGVRANKKVLVLEALAPGGQIINAKRIDNYPGLPGISGVDFATNLYNQIIELGAIVKFEKVISINYPKVITNENVYESKAIIIATGRDNRKIGIEREEYYLGKGLSYCATCDGNFYKDKVVSIYGSGNNALNDAIYLCDICKDVYLINKNDSYKSDETILKELEKKDNVHFIYNSVITRLLGEVNLTGIELNNNELLNIDGLFVDIGQIPETENFINVLDLNEKGYAISTNCRTKIKGIYVCGDIVEKPLRQLATAIGDGANAATIAIQDINSKII